MAAAKSLFSRDTIFRFEDKSGTEAPAIIINDHSLKKVKLVLYKPGA